MKKILCFQILAILLINFEVLSQTAFENAIDFDGNGDYANTFNNPYFPTINGTIETWIKLRSISLPGGNQGEAFVAKNEEQWNNGDFYVFFEYSTGKLKSRIQKPPSIEVDVASNSNFWQSYNQWFHYAFTWGSEGMKMYINGVLQYDQNSLTYSALNNDYNFYIGAHGYMLHNGTYVVSDFFDGQIDELRIWNYQKSSQQILALKETPLDSLYFVTIDSGLVGYWKFDELEDLGINNDGPDDVRDFSVLHNHLDLSGDAHLVSYSTITASIFEKTFGGMGQERGIGIDLTLDGGFIISGSTGSFTSNEVMYLIKLDSLGNLDWSKLYNAFGFDKLAEVKQNSDGSFYLSGFIEGGFGFFDQVILKVDNIGNVLWAKNFGGIEADELRKLSITPDGGLLAAGYNASFGAGAKEIQAIKLLNNGTVEWAKTYGTFYEDFNSSCIVASDGNYLLAGALDIDGSYDIRANLIKLDTLGNIIWAKYYAGFNDDWARDVIETLDGGLLVSGDTRSYGLGGSQDIYLIKTDYNGDVEWAKAYGGLASETGYSVGLTSDGNYIVAGYTNSFGFGGYDAFLMKVDVNGILEWFHTYGGYTSDYAYDVIETPDLGYILSGRRSSNTIGGDDVYIIKTDQNGISSCEFGIHNPNIFNISNLQSIDLNLVTVGNISVADLNLSVITPNTGQNNSCGIIPVELKSFNYQLENNDVILKWTTATEINNMGFKILRDDSEIGFVTGAGNSSEIREYSFRDKSVNNGKYVYSLIQIDYDGTEEKVSEIEIVVSNTPTIFKLLQNYPNPFNPTTIIKFAVPEKSFVSLTIYNFLGQEVSKLVSDFFEPGFYSLELDGSNLPSGIYFYTFLAEGYSDTKKMILIK